MDKMGKELLKVPYVHLVTTMPHAFNGLARRNEKEMYNLLFRVTSKTVKEIADNPAHLGAKTGMVSPTRPLSRFIHLSTLSPPYWIAHSYFWIRYEVPCSYTQLADLRRDR